MSLTKFRSPSLRDKQETQAEVEDPRFEKMVETLSEEEEETK